MTVFKKGDDLWYVQIEGWRRDIGQGIVTPTLHHAVVTGGGEYLTIVTWDSGRQERGGPNRWAEMSHTKEEAFERAKKTLEYIRLAAYQRMDDAANALVFLEELRKEDGKTEG